MIVGAGRKSMIPGKWPRIGRVWKAETIFSATRDWCGNVSECGIPSAPEVSRAPQQRGRSRGWGSVSRSLKERNPVTPEIKGLLDRIYSLLPVPLQNLAFSLWGLEVKRLRYGPYFTRALRFLKSSEWWPRTQMQAYQDTKLREVIADAYENVPYYRHIFRSHGIKPQHVQRQEDLKNLPILSKGEVRARSRDLMNRRLREGGLHVNRTSGTTGSPLEVYVTREAMQFQWAVAWRHRARFGLHLGDRYLMFGARLPAPNPRARPPFWRYNHAANQVYLSTYHLTRKSMPVLIKWLNEEFFDFFAGYPSAMYVLATFLLEHGYRLMNRPKVVVTGADSLLPCFESAIRQAFGVPVTEYYGLAECIGSFSKCEEGIFHLDFELGIAELLPVPGVSDRAIRRLVLTGLANPAMPLIRYDTGDYVRLSNTSCRCGRQSPCVKCIDGRVEDFIRTPDGRMAIGMNQVFEWAPGIWEAQIRQNSLDTLDVLVVPNGRFCDSDLEILEGELRKRLGFSIHINFRAVESIPRTDNGKLRAVISNLPRATTGELELSQATAKGTL
jgi:phenylacetate-CoA ligase